MNRKEVEQFTELMRPMIKWLAENHHPHCMLVITNDNATLYEGLCSTGRILDYIDNPLNPHS